MRIKICGITRTEQAVAISALGVDTLGFICAPQSPRYVTPTQISAITAQLPSHTRRIGVFVNESLPQINNIVKSGLTGVQLHGEESPQTCTELRMLLDDDIEIIKALRIKDRATLAACEDYADCVDTLLLDAYHPQSRGGTGITIDWSLMQDWRSPLTWLLAGGITPENAIVAMQLNPDGLDLSSGVERSPGDKDIDRVVQLLQQVTSSK